MILHSNALPNKSGNGLEGVLIEVGITGISAHSSQNGNNPSQYWDVTSHKR
jgi:hypothetical protein